MASSEQICMLFTKILIFCCGILMIILAILDFKDFSDRGQTMDLLNGVWHIYWM